MAHRELSSEVMSRLAAALGGEESLERLRACLHGNVIPVEARRLLSLLPEKEVRSLLMLMLLEAQERPHETNQRVESSEESTEGRHSREGRLEEEKDETQPAMEVGEAGVPLKCSGRVSDVRKSLEQRMRLAGFLDRHADEFRELRSLACGKKIEMSTEHARLFRNWGFLAPGIDELDPTIRDVLLSAFKGEVVTKEGPVLGDPFKARGEADVRAVRKGEAEIEAALRRDANRIRKGGGGRSLG